MYKNIGHSHIHVHTSKKIHFTIEDVIKSILLLLSGHLVIHSTCSANPKDGAQKKQSILGNSQFVILKADCLQ